jgi:hypothetical protein
VPLSAPSGGGFHQHQILSVITDNDVFYYFYSFIKKKENHASGCGALSMAEIFLFC